MSVILGIDGGGTKTHIAIKDDNNRISLEQAPGTNHEVIGYKEVRFILERGIVKLLKKTGIDNKDIEAACMGMAGIDFDVDKANFRREVINKLPLECEVLLENDAYIALRTGTKAVKGIVINAGTAVKVLGVSGSSEIYSNAVGVGSIQHRILYAMGMELELGREDGNFSRDIAKNLRVENPWDYLQWVFLNNDPRKEACPYSPEQLSGFPAAFFAILRQGNDKAMLIFDEMIGDYAELAAAMVKRLGMRNEKYDLVLSGSVFTRNLDFNFEEAFFTAFGCLESGLAPAKIIILKDPPYIGALTEGKKFRAAR